MTFCGLMVVAVRYRYPGLAHGATSTIAAFSQHATTEPGTE
jgi:hypothetical protein